MQSKGTIQELQAYIRRLKKQKPSHQTRKAIERGKALLAVFNGRKIELIAQVFGFSLKTLKTWVKKYKSDGLESLFDESRSGRPSELNKEQKAALKQKIAEDNQRVWTARHVYDFLLVTFGVTFSVKYLPQLLGNLGLSYHKTLYDLVKKDSEKRRKWMEEQLPAIYQKKLKEGWKIFYQDEVGFSREGTLTNSWGLIGGKKRIPNYGRGKKINLIGVFELGSGQFFGELEEETVDGQRFKEFLFALRKRFEKEKLVLICDNAPFHKSKELKEWYPTQQSWLSIEFLPAYSPDFNPIERLWKWFKTEFTHNRCWKTNGLLLRDLMKIVEKLIQGQFDLTDIMKKENERFKDIAEHYQTDFQQQFLC